MRVTGTPPEVKSSLPIVSPCRYKSKDLGKLAQLDTGANSPFCNYRSQRESSLWSELSASRIALTERDAVNSWTSTCACSARWPLRAIDAQFAKADTPIFTARSFVRGRDEKPFLPSRMNSRSLHYPMRRERVRMMQPPRSQRVSLHQVRQIESMSEEVRSIAQTKVRLEVLDAVSHLGTLRIRRHLVALIGFSIRVRDSRTKNVESNVDARVN